MIKYGMAQYDRFALKVEGDGRLPMDGVESGLPLHEHLLAAGANGWDLRTAFACGITGRPRPALEPLRRALDEAANSTEPTAVKQQFEQILDALGKQEDSTELIKFIYVKRD